MNTVKTELAHSAHTHRADEIVKLDLLELNCISHKEKVVKLAILLEDDNVSMCTVMNLPKNDDFIGTLKGRVFLKENTSECFKLKELCIDVWQKCESKWTLCVAYVKHVISNGYIVDHLHRAVHTCNDKWKCPSIKYIQMAETDQPVNCIVEGELEYRTDTRKRYCLIENIKAFEKVIYEHLT